MVPLRAALYELSDSRFPGLRARHYRLLGHLPAEGERLSRIAAASGLTKQALAQALAPLEAGGYVEVVPDPHDRRARTVRLTDRGRAVNAAVRVRLAEVEDGWAERVGQDRWATARSVLTELGRG
jgi:DNA-binding MarR family transcriptional regulator